MRVCGWALIPTSWDITAPTVASAATDLCGLPRVRLNDHPGCRSSLAQGEIIRAGMHSRENVPPGKRSQWELRTMSSPVVGGFELEPLFKPAIKARCMAISDQSRHGLDGQFGVTQKICCFL